MSRILPTLVATTALALGLAAPIAPAYAAAAFDGTWVFDVPGDIITGTGGDPTCPPLRLRLQVADNQISGNWRRSYPEAGNVVENGNSNIASRVTGDVRSDGSMTTQWQNFHAAGKMVEDRATLTMQTACGPLLAVGHRLDAESMEIVSAASSQTAAASASFATQTASSSPAEHRDGYNVYFAFDRSKLTSTGHGIVDAAVKATQGDQARRISLIGKADRSGTDPYNMALSERRADRVRDAMIAGGVPADRIDVRWVGEREPPIPTANGVHEARNRVVQLVIQ